MQSLFTGRRCRCRQKRQPEPCKIKGWLGFTLIQILIVVGIIVLLSAILFPAVSRMRAEAGRAQCDTRLKAIALALNAYRQEHGAYPLKLETLVQQKYLNEPLRCPDDPRPDGSYDEFYIVRSARDRSGLPILVCPFHEQQGQHGAQAFTDSGGYTRQFITRPAVLEGANGVTLLRPGKKPVAAAAGMELYGGDRLQTASGGIATIRFADTSMAEIAGSSDVTVLQSFIQGQASGPLYSLMRQSKGTATYTVNHGSHFDVATPTTTAGALGTKFKLVVDSQGETTLTVIEGKVFASTLQRTALALLGTVTSLLPTLPGLPDLPHLLGL
jgi:type II secretory pathway pseudopilin PulG